MAARLQSPLASAATRALGVRPRHLERHRLVLSDGAATTLHVATHDLRRTVPRVVRLPRRRRSSAGAASTASPRRSSAASSSAPPARRWASCAPSGIARARACRSTRRGSDVRACLHVVGGHVALARRDELPAEPHGDLLQAGPLLVRDGVPCVDGDVEGFSAGARPVRLRHHRRAATRAPRSALTRRRRLLAVACDGRADDEAGLTLAELAEALVALGARARRSTSTAAARPRWSAAAGCATSRARTTASCWPAAGRSRPRSSFTPRNRLRGYNRRVRVAQRPHVLPPRRLGARGAGAGPRAARARLGRDGRLRARSTAATATPSASTTGCDVARGATSTRGDAPMHPSYEDRPDAPDRVFAALDDDAYEAPRRRLGARAGARRAPPTPTSCTCTT